MWLRSLGGMCPVAEHTHRFQMACDVPNLFHLGYTGSVADAPRGVTLPWTEDLFELVDAAA